MAFLEFGAIYLDKGVGITEKDFRDDLDNVRLPRTRRTQEKQVSDGPVGRAHPHQEHLVGAAGLEPATVGLEIRCSVRLSYAPMFPQQYGASIAQPLYRFQPTSPAHPGKILP